MSSFLLYWGNRLEVYRIIDEGDLTEKYTRQIFRRSQSQYLRKIGSDLFCWFLKYLCSDYLDLNVKVKLLNFVKLKTEILCFSTAYLHVYFSFLPLNQLHTGH